MSGTESEERVRSHWGWGWADRFPGAEARRQMVEHLRMLVGFGGSEPEEPVALEAVEMPEPRRPAPTDLPWVTDDRELRIRHTYGRAFPDLLRGFRGDFRGAPDWVGFPESEEQVAATLEWASENGVTVVPVGGATSVVGGVDTGEARAEGAAGGAGDGVVLALSLRRLSQVLEVDRESLSARIQAGATGPELEQQLAAHGLTLRHFPQSFEFSTLGGWIATRAGGHFATVYTHIDDLVQSIRTVTPAGVMESRRLPGSGAGPSPDRLVLGSEGTLGVITEAWMRVRPRPRFRSKANVFFDDWSAAVDAVRAVAQSGLFPSNCRLLDKREAMLNAVSFEGRHVLLLGFESAELPTKERLELALGLALGHGGDCPDGPAHRQEDGRAENGEKSAAESWRQAFLEAPYLQSTLLSVGVIADTFETACPWDRFAELHAAVVKEVRAEMKRVCGAGFLSCRFTHVYPDGPAPYFTWLAPARRGEELEQWRAIKTVASDVLLAHGGTITHHHAVGRTHRPWAEQQRPSLFGEALSKVKSTLDPAGILNPGVLIPTEPEAESGR